MSLLDIESGDHLWQDSMKGQMSDIFDLQEQAAEKVVEGLKIHLEPEEIAKLAERGTENDEAYALLMKASEYFQRRTGDSFRIAIELLSESIKLDPGYGDALEFKAYVLCELNRAYDRDPQLLVEAEELAKKALEVKPNLHKTFGALSFIYRLQKKLTEAEEAAKEFIRRAPNDSAGHFGLGFFYMETNQPAKAIPCYEKASELGVIDTTSYFNLVITCDQAGDKERTVKWALTALPVFEKRLRLAPDDEVARVWYANLLWYAGDSEKAIEAAKPLALKQNLDGSTLYNIACLYAKCGDAEDAMKYLERTVEGGFHNLQLFLTDPDLKPLHGRADFDALLRQLEAENG